MAVIYGGVLKGLYELTQPKPDWRPMFDRIEAKPDTAQQTQIPAEASEAQTALSTQVIDQSAANPKDLISISIGVKYGDNGPSTKLNFAFDPDFPQDLVI